MDSEILLALVAFAAAFFLRRWPRAQRFIWPLNLFAVLVHELMHGLAALLTGGKFKRFEMSRTGGLAYTVGGWRWLILPAGYVGTAVFGAALLVATNSLDDPSWIAVALGAGFSLLTLLFSGMGPHKLNVIEVAVSVVVFGGAAWLFSSSSSGAVQGLAVAVAMLGAVLLVRFMADEYFFTVVIGMVTGLALLFLGLYSADSQNTSLLRFVLNFLAFMVGLNAIFDSWYLFQLIQEPGRKQADDATAMSREIGGPAFFWAVAWSLSSLLMLGVALAAVLS